MRTLLPGLMSALSLSVAAEDPAKPRDEPPAAEERDRRRHLVLGLENGGHVGGLGLHFAPNGKRLISVGEDRTVQVWNVETGPRL